MQAAELRLVHLGENIRAGGLSDGHGAPHCGSLRHVGDPTFDRLSWFRTITWPPT
jgi:hypothetical protein